MYFEHSKPSEGIERSVIFHNCERQLDSATRELAKILGIKLSKAKEHHSKAVGKNSYNGALFSLRESTTIGVELDEYISALDAIVKKKHKREITQEQHLSIIEKISTPISKLYESISFYQFFRYSLIKSDQVSPLMSDIALHKSMYDAVEGFKGDADTLLYSYLMTGEVDSNLISLIDKSLVVARKVMSNRLPSEWVNVKNGRYDKKRLLAQFKVAVDTYLTGDIYHTYYIPVVYRTDSITDKFFIGEFDADVRKSRALVDKIRKSGRNVVFGCNFNHLNQCFIDANDYLDGLLSDYESYYFGYASPLSIPYGDMDPMFNENLVSIPEGVIDYNSPYYLRFWNNIDRNPLEAVVDGMWEMEDHNNDPCSSETLVQVMVIEGVPLSKNDIKEHSKSFIELFSVDNEKCFFGNFIKVDNNSRDDVLRLIGESISSVLKVDDQAIAFIFNNSNSLYAIDRNSASAPFGRSTEVLASFGDCFIYNRDLWYDYDLSINSDIEVIARNSGFNQKFIHTYSNNLTPLEEFKVDYEAYEFCFDDFYAEATNGCQIEYTTFESANQFVNNLPFKDCRNVYVLSCDRGYFDEPILFVGFNEEGEQVLNANLYLSDPTHSDRAWDFLEILLRKMRLTISGFYEQWSIELGYPTFGDNIMIDPNCNEEGYLSKHTFYEQKTGIDPQESRLKDVYVSIPEGLSVADAEIELKKKLPCLEIDGGHSYIKLESEVPTPYFISSSEGRKWYAGKTTSETDISHLPIQRFDVNGTDISIFQETYNSKTFSSYKNFQAETSKIEDNDPFGMLNKNLYRPLFVAFVAQSEAVAKKYEGKYELTSDIPVNDLAAYLNELSNEELFGLRRMSI